MLSVQKIFPPTWVELVIYNNKVCDLIGGKLTLKFGFSPCKIIGYEKSLQNIILEIHNKEDKISSQSRGLIDESMKWPCIPKTRYFQLRSLLLKTVLKTIRKKYISFVP